MSGECGINQSKKQKQKQKQKHQTTDIQKRVLILLYYTERYTQNDMSDSYWI